MKLRSKSRIRYWRTPAIMGVLNVTPDSFSDGGAYRQTDDAVARALTLLEEGADIIDIGGESTRPGADPVDEAEELDRVLPVIEALRPATDAMISVDTGKPGVIATVCAAGADMINDVRALRVPGALQAAAVAGVAVCLMHMQGQPRTMQVRPHYDDVVGEIGEFLAQRMAVCIDAGIGADRIVLDPGFGFGKTLAHNLALLRHLETIAALGSPLLVGLSRKSMFSTLLGDTPPSQRLPASVSAAAIAVLHGAKLVRTHDVAATRQGVMLAAAIRGDNE